MKCSECNQERGCGCSFHKVESREYKVCSDCKVKIENAKKDGAKSAVTPPNVQGV